MRGVIIGFLVVLGGLVHGTAQGELGIEQRTVRKIIQTTEIDAYHEEVMRVSISNTSDQTQQLRWDREVVFQPLGWESQICDLENSYPPEVNSNYDPLKGLVAPVVLAPGESFDLYLTIFPYQIPGQCQVEVTFRDLDKPDKIIGTVDFQLQLQDPATRAALSRSRRPRLYPNPVHDQFFINNAPEMSRVEVYNSLGVRVKVFRDPRLGDSFNVADLPQGVYLLSLIGTDEKVIRTMRMVRRDFRP